MVDFRLKIAEVIETFMSKGLEFSAHNVTTELRSQGETIWHNAETKKEIHNEIITQMSNFNYEMVYEKEPSGGTFKLYKPMSQPMSQNLTSDFDGVELNFDNVSSWVIGSAYNAERKELFIETVSGKNYIFKGVNPEIINEWERAHSVGAFFTENIKDVFDWSEA